MEPYVNYFQYTEYKVGDLIDWHEDRTSNIYRVGTYSTTIQLNDNYDGGIFEIKNLNGELIPIENKKGSLYMFKPNLSHRITMVESGNRYSLINWVSLVKTDKTKQNLI
jgi:predicted 2-oxoglutarate/Fe(II)-dependent dioxygenase YbiX